MKEDLLRMIKYAYTNVPLYEKKNIDITLIKDIKDIPVIKKEEIMIDWEEGISSNYLMKYLQGKLMSSWTSGSTGKCCGQKSSTINHYYPYGYYDIGFTI